MDNQSKEKKTKISSSKSIGFWLILFLIPVISILLLETGLRFVDYGENLSLFEEGHGRFSNFMYMNRWVAKRYFGNSENVPDPVNDVFLKDKPINGYRIFVLGGSTAAGWPYPNNLMFSRILNIKLSQIFPEKHIEVVNTSISAINSYAQLDFVEEILEYEPDAVLIYSGHNEYYGAFGTASTQTIGNARWLKNLYLDLVHFKTFQLVNDFINLIAGLFSSEKSGEGDISETMMERLVSDQNIPFGSELYKDGIDQFSDNLTDIIDALKYAEVPVIVSHLVSNIKDQPPFMSSEGETNADQLFNYAKQMEVKLEIDSAKEAYIKAKEFDLLRFRAPEEINRVIDQIAEEHSVPVVQMEKYFEDASFNSIIGSDLMLDHLHPNITGYFLMAEAFYNKIKEEKLLSEEWPENSDFARNELVSSWGKTNLDIVYANLRLAHLKGGWPFKPAGTENSAIEEFVFEDGREKLALRIWQDRNYTTEDAHADIANFLESNNSFEAAFKEYNTLICLKPYNYSAYLNAARMLIKTNKKQEAIPFLLESLKHNKTAYAYQWIGIALYEQGNYKEAATYMAEVYKLNIKEPILLYCLGSAYLELNNPDLARLMADELQPLAAKDQYATGMYLQLKSKIKSVFESN